MSDIPTHNPENRSPRSSVLPATMAEDLPDSYRALIAGLDRHSLKELRTRHRRLRKTADEIGLHYRIGEEKPAAEPPLLLDIFPNLIDHEEWSRVSAGLLQRMHAFNGFVSDIYGEQRILQDRVVPFDYVLGDPAFLREIRHLPAAAEKPVLVAAVDLVKSPGGQWSVFENHFALPFGVSYVLQNRRMFVHAFPELFKDADIQPVAGFGTELVEALRKLSPVENPHIVLLTDAESNRAYFEESFLARRMGIAMVKPADLVVRESRVFFRTVGGLEQVDVIYRRMRSTAVDPVSLASTSMGGIPGLLSCLRRGTVAVANMIGSGIADNKALLPYSDSIIRYYLDEEPLLPTLPTIPFAGTAHTKPVRKQPGNLRLRPIQSEASIHDYCVDRLHIEESANLRKLLRLRPELIVGQPPADFSHLPRFSGGRFIRRPVLLRAFVICGEPPFVLPGGLTFQARYSGRWMPDIDSKTGSKDTWVQLASRRPAQRREPPFSHPSLRDYHIGSRTAEALYWIGRYTERAEATVRMLSVLEELKWEDMDHHAQSMLWPLWQAIAEATGHETYTRLTELPENTLPLSRSLVLEGADPASVLSCLRSVHGNAGYIREVIPPEVWRIINRLYELLEPRAQRKNLSQADLQELCRETGDAIAALNGTADRTMLRDDGWLFMRTGAVIERAFSTLHLMEKVLGHAVSVSMDHLEENPDLTALLRILASLDAYRREYRSRAYVGRVAELLWKSEESPSSVAFCARELLTNLQRLSVQSENGAKARVRAHLEALTGHIARLSCDEVFPFTVDDPEEAVDVKTGTLGRMRARMEKECRDMTARFTALHDMLEDGFFHHQFEMQHQPGMVREQAAKTEQ